MLQTTKQTDLNVLLTPTGRVGQGLGKGFLCPFGRVLTNEGRVRSGNGTSDFLTKFMNVVLFVKFSQLLKRHRKFEITVVYDDSAV